MSDNFEWPCPRREAHGRHTAGDPCDCGGHWDDSHMGDCAIFNGMCHGVAAHPDTMIGDPKTRVRARYGQIDVGVAVMGSVQVLSPKSWVHQQERYIEEGQ